LLILCLYMLAPGCQRAKYEIASSNTTRTTFAFDACFVWKLAPLADERNGIFHRISIATIDAIEYVCNVINLYLACSVPSMSLHRVILLDQRLRLTRVLYGHFSGATSGERAKRFFLHRLSTATIYAFEQVSNVANSYS
jgi:hypothetical protein